MGHALWLVCTGVGYGLLLTVATCLWEDWRTERKRKKVETFKRDMQDLQAYIRSLIHGKH